MKFSPIALILYFSLPLYSLKTEFLPVYGVDLQPFAAASDRLIEALQFAGSPIDPDDANAINEWVKAGDADEAVLAIQEILDRYCVAGVRINAESRVTVESGPAEKLLFEQGWRSFLVKVHNEAGITPILVAESPNAAPQFRRSTAAKSPSHDITASDVANRWLDIEMLDRRPLNPRLSGLAVEYRIVQLYSRDAGKREAKLAFNVGQGTQDIGFRNEVAILFDCSPASEVRIKIRDLDGTPISAAFVVRDQRGRVYPNPARRLAPDFYFHDQVYRADGEFLLLPPGDYTVTASRGPEYHPQTKSFTVRANEVPPEIDFQLERWIHPANRNWYSGDHHVHAAGCAHYENPTEGVSPADMMRHILGEDLNVGCVLTWGPCWYSQKQYFEGKDSVLSTPNYLMRYDIEVSGFPSSHAGHLCLLRLKEDDYPGTTLVEEWPSWTIPVLDWGKKQGGVVGYSHSGWGLGLPDVASNGQRLTTMPYRNPGRGQARVGKAVDTLPDYAVPPFDGIGANEFIVAAPLGVCDFISAVDTPSIWELNIWYHTLNCGLRTRISGETDFPCIYGDKVGLGRVYVKLDDGQPLDFDSWVLGLKNGRSYCGDGMSHLIDFTINEVAVGEPGTRGEISQLDISKPGLVTVNVDAAALLAQNISEQTESIRNSRLDSKPYWHIERCRIDDTRTVPVEVIVNGEPVAREIIVADGVTRPLEFEINIKSSSWVALRILPSVHTNPVFVIVDDQPIRANKRSAEWCIESVETCWDSKKGQINESERPQARQAYDQAREYYQTVLAETSSSQN